MNNISNTIKKPTYSTLSNKYGLEISISNFGASLTSLKIPLPSGEKIDVVLGFDTVNNYKKSFDLPSAPYFGSIVGRYAGRIANGNFELDGKQHQLFQNNNRNSLHGGKEGFSQKNWIIIDSKSTKNSSVTLEYTSPSYEENYPGELKVLVTYTLSESNELAIEYNAISSEDTIINLTHHSYFNLDGHASTIENQKLMVASNTLLETNKDNIPTGSFIDLSDHEFNFNVPKKCPIVIDNTFVIADSGDVVSASLFNPKNNLKMEVITNQPGIHIYVGGNCFGKIKGKEGAHYHPLSGICFETQNYPDAPNHDNFPNAVIKKGERYYHKTIYRFKFE